MHYLLGTGFRFFGARFIDFIYLRFTCLVLKPFSTTADRRYFVFFSKRVSDVDILLVVYANIFSDFLKVEWSAATFQGLIHDFE